VAQTRFPVGLVALTSVLITVLCGHAYSQAPNRVFVSILPQKYFVERIGGSRVDVHVMVQPGHSPETYEPTPQQMAELSRASLYLTVGVPFEKVWLDRIKSLNPQLRVIDTSQRIKRRHMETHTGSEQGGRRHDTLDPHIWTSPRLVMVQARTICSGLVDVDPENEEYYQRNLKDFLKDLSSLDERMQAAFKDVRERRFMVFHPAWGYLADEYGLEQIPVEIEGKKPGARALFRVIDIAKREGIKVVFVQPQFSTKSAEAIAQAIGGRVVVIDPLAEDYLTNMRQVTETLVEVLR